MQIKMLKDCIQITDMDTIIWIHESKITELVRACVEYKREQKRKKKHPEKYPRRQTWGV